MSSDDPPGINDGPGPLVMVELQAVIRRLPPKAQPVVFPAPHLAPLATHVVEGTNGRAE